MNYVAIRFSRKILKGEVRESITCGNREVMRPKNAFILKGCQELFKDGMNRRLSLRLLTVAKNGRSSGNNSVEK
jgi:hypothetical protein